MAKRTKIFSFSIALVLILSLCTSCYFPNFESSSSKTKTEDVSDEKISYNNVTLVYNNGTDDNVFSVQSGSTFKTPDDPEKDNYIFTGWYENESLTNKYDFSQSVNSDITLYAGYEIDAVSITNNVSQEAIKGVVKIYNKSYNTNRWGIETSYSISQGSGFCFRAENGYYYILTNCHVALKNSSYSNQSITIEDYQGNTYTGYIYNNAIDSSYDLACIRFKSSSTNVQALDIASNPEISDDVISLGSPKGQTNFIAYGKVNTFKTISLENSTPEQSNITFDVIEHTAYIDGGSSGGPLLNADLQVVGVNYAGNDKTQSSEVHSYAVPAEKVIEFLQKYSIN